MRNHLASAKESLEERRNHYARLFEQAPVGFLKFDIQGYVEAANARACQLIAQDRLRVQGRPFVQWIGGATWAASSPTWPGLRQR